MFLLSKITEGCTVCKSEREECILYFNSNPYAHRLNKTVSVYKVYVLTDRSQSQIGTVPQAAYYL